LNHSFTYKIIVAFCRRPIAKSLALTLEPSSRVFRLSVERRSRAPAATREDLM
jgi:hypothetical protein